MSYLLPSPADFYLELFPGPFSALDTRPPFRFARAITNRGNSLYDRKFLRRMERCFPRLFRGVGRGAANGGDQSGIETVPRDYLPRRSTPSVVRPLNGSMSMQHLLEQCGLEMLLLREPGWQQSREPWKRTERWASKSDSGSFG